MLFKGGPLVRWNIGDDVTVWGPQPKVAKRFLRLEYGKDWMVPRREGEKEYFVRTSYKKKKTFSWDDDDSRDVTSWRSKAPASRYKSNVSSNATNGSRGNDNSSFYHTISSNKTAALLKKEKPYRKKL
jgi:hypothetical protein